MHEPQLICNKKGKKLTMSYYYLAVISELNFTLGHAEFLSAGGAGGVHLAELNTHHIAVSAN
jgi:hypothetical protein